MPDTSAAPRLIAPLRVSRLAARKPNQIALAPDAATCAAIANYLGITALRKFRFTGVLRPEGRSDWQLRADLGATVVQDCAVTLAPVTTRIDEQVTRRFLADMPQPEGLEVEMPEDDTAEPLGAEIDISALAIEALALALPAFPRAPGAELSPSGQVAHAPEDATPLPESPPKPFAALEALKSTLEQGSKPPRDNED